MQTRHSRPTRRQFNTGLLAGAIASMSAPAFLRGRNLNDKLNIAVIGTGGRGGSNLNDVSSENIVALCDVNAHSVESTSVKHPKAKTYADFRKVFDDADGFDAVVV